MSIGHVKFLIPRRLKENIEQVHVSEQNNLERNRILRGMKLPESSPEDNRSKFNCSSNLDKQFATWPPPLVCTALTRLK
jgi:hypothetical protein